MPSLSPLTTSRPSPTSATSSVPPTPTSAKGSKSLNDYQLGDCLGKGAFGQVYRALNWATGETVAIKEIELTHIPKGELGEIMSEIDLLKNLNHPNIVKYKGFVKTKDYLYIILEFCENGSLHAISKRFGKFPEGLVAVYISQVLEGLVYLHDQGVIHRDIKGANILTNKDGTVKLADFGVAANTTATTHVNDGAVVGSPYWMAPEVIEQSGATTASDIWSVGCVVIELLDGKPPYANLSPMPALWRIVQDDCPPLPDSASSIVKDFLMHCFQKDANLRISAKKLLRHPWMVSARKQMGAMEEEPPATESSNHQRRLSPQDVAGAAARRPLSNYNFDEAVLKVQEWNEALRSPSRPSKHPSRAPHPRQFSRPSSPTPAGVTEHTASGIIVPSFSSSSSATARPPSTLLTPAPSTSVSSSSSSIWKLGSLSMSTSSPIQNNPGGTGAGLAEKLSQRPPLLGSGHLAWQAKETEEDEADNWDDDFEIGEGVSLNVTKLHASENNTSTSSGSAEDNTKTIRPNRSPPAKDKDKDGSKGKSKGKAHVPPPLPTMPASIKENEGEDDDYEFGDADMAEKVADFKMKNRAVSGTRRGLFHPDDIKSHLTRSPSPRTSPLPPESPLTGLFNLPGVPSSKPRRPSLSPLIPTSPLASVGPGPLSASLRSTRSSSPGPILGLTGGSHSRSSSFANAASSLGSASGSAGRKELRKMASQAEFEKYAEDDADEDYEDVFFGKSIVVGGKGLVGMNGTNGAGRNGVTGKGEEGEMQTLQLNTRLSNKSWLGDDDDEEDPFAEIDDHLEEDDLETNLQRDKYARLCSTVNGLIDELTPAAPDFQLREACDSLLNIIDEAPEMLSQLVSSHGMLAILEVLEGKCGREVILRLLRIVNVLVNADPGFLESFCLIGGIPVMMGFTSKKYPPECRVEASDFIRLLCHTSVLTLQMFISCRGLKVLVDLLDEDYTEQGSLVVHALNGIGSVFELQSPTTKNDFCRMFIREGLLDPLSAALLNVMAYRTHDGPRSRASSNASFRTETEETKEDLGGELGEMKMKIIQILLVFCHASQSDVHIRNALGTRKVVRRLLRACELLEPDCLVHMLKAVKHLSMNATFLEVLQNANALEILIRILDEQSSGPHSTEMANHIFQTCYNLCRLNKSRQEEAAQAGLIPCLQRVIETSSPLRQFALPILCDLASAGKSCRTLLWQHNGFGMYIRLLDDPYFQVSSLESILSWLQDETARIEDQLTQPSAIDALVRCFTTAKANSFENLLDPFLKILRLSSNVTIAIARSPALFKRIVDRLSHHAKPVVRLNLLRILRTVCEVHPNRSTLVERYALLDVVESLSKNDGAVLVKELAREIIPVLRPGLAPGKSGFSSVVPGSRPAKIVSRDRQHYSNSSRDEGAALPSPVTKSAIAPKKSRIRRTASESTFVGPAPPSAPATISSATSSQNGSLSSTARGPLQAASRTKSSRTKLGDIWWAGERNT